MMFCRVSHSPRINTFPLVGTGTGTVKNSYGSTTLPAGQTGRFPPLPPG